MITIKVKDVTSTLVDRQGTFRVVPEEYATKLEQELNQAKALLREMAMLLIPPPGTNMVEILREILEDVKVLDFIREYNLCVSHSSAKAKTDKGQEWAVQDNKYSELFERSTLDEAVIACVKKLQQNTPFIYVDSLLTKGE